MDKIDISSLDERLQLEIEKLKIAGLFSKEKIILMSDEEFRDVGDFTKENIRSLKNLVSKSILPLGFIQASNVETVYNRKWRTICLDCHLVDSLLDGGIPTRGITELSGKSGLGKTQFCLQLCLTVQYPEEAGGLSLGAVYLSTEAAFPSKRLHQLAQHFPKNGVKINNFDENIFIDHIATVHFDHVDVEVIEWIYHKLPYNDLTNPEQFSGKLIMGRFDEFKICLTRRLPMLLNKFSAGLLIVDSITALFRTDYDEYITRARDIRRIGLLLHKLSTKYGLAVLCVNQSVDHYHSMQVRGYVVPPALADGGRETENMFIIVSDIPDKGTSVPALGLVWANLVTTKLQLKRSDENQRFFHVLSAPHLPPNFCSFYITESGIQC